MGPGESAGGPEMILARQLGSLIAKNEWILLSGGRKTGVMGAVNESYMEHNGPFSVGISPTNEEGMSENVDLIISTNMHSGRNYINALSSNIMVAIGDLSSAGTLSEVALGLIKNKPFEKKTTNRPIIIIGKGIMVNALLEVYKNQIIQVNSAPEAIDCIRKILNLEKNTIY